MSEFPELQNLLARELRHVRPPDDLWRGIPARLERSAAARQRTVPSQWLFSVAAVIAVFALIPSSVWLGRGRDPVFDLGPYLGPVRDSSLSRSAPAIYNAPPEFADSDLAIEPARLDGYSVAARRVRAAGGARVEQIVYDGGSSPVSLFVMPASMRVSFGSEPSYPDRIAGVPCRRVNCRRQRTVEFACAAARCVLVCKACTEAVLASLVGQLAR